jgi:hypothetical protein
MCRHALSPAVERAYQRRAELQQQCGQNATGGAVELRAMSNFYHDNVIIVGFGRECCACPRGKSAMPLFLHGFARFAREFPNMTISLTCFVAGLT